MYGPKWPFLLMYGSHDMRHTSFPQVDGFSTDPRDLGRHTFPCFLLVGIIHSSLSHFPTPILNYHFRIRGEKK